MSLPLPLLLLLSLACPSRDNTDSAAGPSCPAPVPGPAPADLDGDGWPDLVFAQTEDAAGAYATTSPIFWGGPDGFSVTDRTDLPTLGADDVAVTDLDGDSHPEVVFASVGDGADDRYVDSLVYRGTPDGPDAASEPLRLPTIGAAAVTVQDVNGDGHPDLFFSNRYDGGSALSDESYLVASRLYWGSATGPSPEVYTEVTTLGAADARFADLDGEGTLDLVVASGTFHTDVSRAWFGGPDGFSDDASVDLPTLAPEGVEVADFDHDGHPDVFFSNFYDLPELDVDSVLYPGSATGPDPARVVPVPTHGATDALAVDLDADGCVDLAVANSMEGSFFDLDFTADSVVLWGTPEGLDPDALASPNAVLLPGSSTAALDAADLDADGDVDLVLAHRYDTEGEPVTSSRIWWNEGGSFDSSRVTDLPTVGAAGVAAHLSQ